MMYSAKKTLDRGEQEMNDFSSEYFCDDKDSREFFEEYNLLVDEITEISAEHEGWCENYDF